MERAKLGQRKQLLIAAAAAALAGCTGSGSSETELPDSTRLAVPEAPETGSQPAQPDSATTPARSPAASPTTPARQTPAQADPGLIQVPPPRDTRPSIPWPPDTLISP